MIQQFSVQNFRSFNEKQTISFEATADKTLADELTYEVKPGVKLLRMAMIYGANASGKSNLLQAIEALWLMLFSTAINNNKVFIYSPFELTKGKPTSFDIIFWIDDCKFQYELIYNESEILYEKMMYSTNKGVLSLMYERKGQEISFGGTLQMRAKQRNEISVNTLINHTVLSTLSKINNLNIPHVMQKLHAWVDKNIFIEGSSQPEISSFLKKNENNPSQRRKEFILELLNEADINISDFNIIEVSTSDWIIRYLRTKERMTESEINQLRLPSKGLFLTHNSINGDFQLDFNLESQGTKTYFCLADTLFELKSKKCIILKDELEDSLHYDLLIHFLQTYLNTSNQSQFIFTTHNQQLLDEDWMVRRDMVWFTEKDRETSATVLYRASDMGIHKNVSLMNAYRIGKLGAKPVLGSTFINVDGDDE